jgi:hypothetical protein
MPKNPEKKRLESHLMPDFLEDLETMSKEYHFNSRKNMVELLLTALVLAWRAKKKPTKRSDKK